MRKFIAFVITAFCLGGIVAGVYATQNNVAGKWSVASILATDTVNVTGHDTIDGHYTVVKVRKNPANAFGLTMTNGSFLNVTGPNDALIDSSTGTTNFGSNDTVQMSGSGSIWKISALNGGITGNPLFIVNGSGDTLQDRKGVTFKRLEMTGNKKFIFKSTSTSSSTFIGSGTGRTIAVHATNPDTIQIDQSLFLYPTAPDTIYSGNIFWVANGLIQILSDGTTGNYYIPATNISSPTGGGISYNFRGTSVTYNVFYLGTLQTSGAAPGGITIQRNNAGTANYFLQKVIAPGGFTEAGNNAGGLMRLSWGDSLVTLVFTTSSTATIFDSIKTVVWKTAGNYTNQTTRTIIPGTSVHVWANTAAQTVTTANALYYDMQKTGTGKTTFVGNVSGNDWTHSAGIVVFPAGSIELFRDYTRTSANVLDSLYRAGTLLQIQRNMITTSTAPTIGDSAFTEFVGIGPHTLLQGLIRMTRVRVVGGGALTQISRVYALLVNDSSGTWCTNGYTLMIDSLLKIGDSTCSMVGDTIKDSGSVLIKSTSRPSLLGIFNMVGNAAATVTGGGNAKSLGRVNVKKGAATTVTTTGVTAYDTLKILTGSFAMTAATDSVYCNVLIDSSTSASTFISPVVVSQKIIVASGANITLSGVGKLLMTSCTAATLNGNSVKVLYPTISPISYTAIVDTVGKGHTHAMIVGGCSLGLDSVKVIGTALPTGYSLTKASGLLTWTTGSAQTATNYTVRAYAGAGTDSATTTVSITVVAPTTSKRRRGVFSLGIWSNGAWSF